MLEYATRSARRNLGDRSLRGIDADDMAQSYVIEQWMKGNREAGLTNRFVRMRCQDLIRLEARQRSGEATRCVRGQESYSGMVETATQPGPAPWLRAALAEALQRLTLPELFLLTVYADAGYNQTEAAVDAEMNRITYHKQLTAVLNKLKGILT